MQTEDGNSNIITLKMKISKICNKKRQKKQRHGSVIVLESKLNTNYLKLMANVQQVVKAMNMVMMNPTHYSLAHLPSRQRNYGQPATGGQCWWWRQQLTSLLGAAGSGLLPQHCHTTCTTEIDMLLDDHMSI